MQGSRPPRMACIRDGGRRELAATPRTSSAFSSPHGDERGEAEPDALDIVLPDGER
ncbi:MAG: hypothetical protein LC751_21250 [Actinobacteria bacterium]|nr:hypothetical protein [Actinomycetota bacterium]MCA1740328.1 hypothetical protein [Actinomycetota bacterium]